MIFLGIMITWFALGVVGVILWLSVDTSTRVEVFFWGNPFPLLACVFGPITFICGIIALFNKKSFRIGGGISKY